jgi:2-polyprenyl-6-methoxyphenol hydroxylase-like FAD-dependent oxidoreductase
MGNHKVNKHAVIIGGSIAGLTTARVLSEYFDQITIVERDHMSEHKEFRSGVPQNKQPHAILKRGLVELENLFPGFSSEFERNGAVSINFGKNVDWFAFGRWRPRYEPGLESLSSSRPLLESTIRQRMQGNPKLCFMNETEVTGLQTDKTNSKVIGIKTRSRAARQIEDVIEADLIIDASGRASHGAEWLQAMGYPGVEITTINSFPGYASAVFDRPQGLDCTTMYIQPVPPDIKRGAIFLPLEGNQIHVCLIGMGKDYPPTDEEGFMNFLASLPEKRLYEMLKGTQPVTPITGYRRAENILHRYDKLGRWPENFMIIGDALCGFNPVYGQGMTVAVLEALKLQEMLASAHGDLSGLAPRTQKELAKVVSFAWDLATGEDMRWLPITEGCPKKLSRGTTAKLGFMKKVMVASTKDPKVAGAFYRVMNMVASPGTFFRPDMMARILAN